MIYERMSLLYERKMVFTKNVVFHAFCHCVSGFAGCVAGVAGRVEMSWSSAFASIARGLGPVAACMAGQFAKAVSACISADSSLTKIELVNRGFSTITRRIDLIVIVS